MPRTLPWLQQQQSTSATPRTPTKPASKRRRLASSPPSSSDELPMHPPSSSRARLKKTQPRSPSTSPPPAPPKQELMRPGWTGDDAWKMVVDEFDAVAASFTSHLAHAEYQRQKALAKRREEALGGADAIARPVVGGLSAEGQRKKKVEMQRGRVRAALQDEGEDDEDSESEDPWMGTQLAGLMMSPRKREKLSAKGFAEGRSCTRAAAGFDRAKPVGKLRLVKQEEKESTDDDLDAAPKASSRASSRPTRDTQRQVRKPMDLSPPPLSRPRNDIKKHQTSRTSSHHTSSSRQPLSTTLHLKPSSSSIKSISQSIKREPSPPPTTPLDPDMSFPSIPQFTQSQTGSSVLARRREARIKREREERERLEASQAHELPTFLF